jgi:hypothetical protein
MIIDCILSSSTVDSTYIDFVPTFIKVWKAIIPLADVKIIIVAPEIPSQLLKYKSHLILFNYHFNIPLSSISQIIRIFYPCIMNYSGGILITDIDMIPMNRKYYIDNIKNIENNKFIYYRDVLMKDEKQFAICYNIATQKTWSDIFNIRNLEDVLDKLKSLKHPKWDSGTKLLYNSKELWMNWSVDQRLLYDKVMNWNNKTKCFINFNDTQTGYFRLDRANIQLTRDIIQKIKNKEYSDYHMLRPYRKYKFINDSIVNYLLNSL